MATILPFVKDGVFDHRGHYGYVDGIGRCVQGFEPAGR